MWDIIANTRRMPRVHQVSCRTPRFDVTWSTGGTGCNSLPRCAASRLHFRFNAASDPWINISSWLRLSRFSFTLPPSFLLTQNCSLSAVYFPSAASPAPPPPPLPSLFSFESFTFPLRLWPWIRATPFTTPRGKYRYLQLTHETPAIVCVRSFATFRRSINDFASSAFSLAPILMHHDIARCNSTKAPGFCPRRPDENLIHRSRFSRLFHGNWTSTGLSVERIEISSYLAAFRFQQRRGMWNFVSEESKHRERITR